MLWDLFQQVQIGRNERHALSVDERLAAIERQLDHNASVLADLISYLEKRDGRDLDGDGKIG